MTTYRLNATAVKAVKVHNYRINGRFVTATRWASEQVRKLRTHIANLNDSFNRKLSLEVMTMVLTCIAKLREQIVGLIRAYNLDYLE